MKSLFRKTVRKLNIKITMIVIGVLLVIAGSTTYVIAALTDNATLSQDITGSLSVDITDAEYNTIATPVFSMTDEAFSWDCKTGGTVAVGNLGTSSEFIYVANPGVNTNGWVLSLGASSTTDTWSNSGDTQSFDFNDPGTGAAGCLDGGTDDVDTVGGEMNIKPVNFSMVVGQCASCDQTGLTKGSTASYNEGTTDSITLVTSDGTQDTGDWKIYGAVIEQTIPAEQSVDTYTIDMVLTLVGS